MVASMNPKKKSQYVAKESTKDKQELTKDSGNIGASSIDLMEQHFGPTLLPSAGAPPKPTTDLLKGKKLVGLYFSASW
jgi:hypothetical protein